MYVRYVAGWYRVVAQMRRMRGGRQTLSGADPCDWNSTVAKAQP
jgi:hypothetical protein